MEHFCGSSRLQWTQEFKTRSKFHFYNPLRQNRTHIFALAEFLKRDPAEFISYIVFSDRCELKSVPANTDSEIIVHRKDLLPHLRKNLASRRSIYTHAEIHDMERRLLRCTEQNTQIQQQHVKDIQTKCPFCSGDLVLREGYNKFWGCSNYPNCRFTKPYDPKDLL